MEQTLQVYVVEDSPTQALGVKRILKRWPQFAVSIFPDGLLAYRAIQRRPPDLLLMDLILPSLHGLALCRLLKFHSDFRSIPILIFSSITEADIAEQALRAGANQFVPKPFTPDQLTTCVEALLTLREKETVA